MREVMFKDLVDISSQMRESLRALRTNIQFCGDDIKVILFTSTVPNEGKSSVVMSLARSWAMAEKKVLIIDTDMRNSVTVKENKAVADEAIIGLSHYLSGQNKMEDIIYTSNVENLDIVFAGRSVPNPTELLENKYFERLLNEVRNRYDYILIDCAPVTAAIDSTLIAQYCDGAVYVIAQDEVPSRGIIRSKQQLEASGVRILGAVLNKVRMDHTLYGNYYGNYYGKYYGYGKTDSKTK